MTAILTWLLQKEVLFALCTVFCAVSGLFRSIRQYQFLQQNSYFPSRYLPCVWGNNRKGLLLSVMAFVLYAVLDQSQPLTQLLFTVLWLVFLILSAVFCIRTQRRSVIPLKFTARIRRMLAVSAVWAVAVCLLQIFVAKGQYYWFMSVAVVCALFPWLTVLFIWALLYPAERLITRHYLKDAKRILASFKDRLTVIGITGSYGKTSTKNILCTMLSERFVTFTTPKNYNTPMGVVRAVREHLPGYAQVFICEMGAKKKGDIKELCDLVHPTLGLITSVGPQHLDTFGNQRAVTDTKFELYDAVKQNGGQVFANTDNELIQARSLSCDLIGYAGGGSRFYADDIEFLPRGQKFVLHLGDEAVSCHTKLLARHDVVNIVGAAALSYSMGVSAKQIQTAVSKLQPVEHRLELKRYIGGSTLIDDAYNANPQGSLEACRVIGRFEAKRRIIVTPGLVELGAMEFDCNVALGKEAADNCDTLILVGKSRSIPLKKGAMEADFKGTLTVVDSFKEAMEVFAPLCTPDTVLLFENDLPDNYLM